MKKIEFANAALDLKEKFDMVHMANIAISYLHIHISQKTQARALSSTNICTTILHNHKNM